MSVNSVVYYVAGITSFFNQFDEIKINWKRINKALPKKIPHKFRSYDLHEITKLLSLADRREAVMILLMASSGVRIGSLTQLTFKDISTTYSFKTAKGEKETKQFPDGIASLHVYAGEAEQYHTFITAECMNAINEYKLYRQEQTHEKITPASFILRDQFANRSIKTSTILKQMWLLFRKCELPAEELQPAHGLRKYFKNLQQNPKPQPNLSPKQG